MMLKDAHLLQYMVSKPLKQTLFFSESVIKETLNERLFRFESQKPVEQQQIRGVTLRFLRSGNYKWSIQYFLLHL